MTVYELALFVGAGGGLLASQWLHGWRTICYVEREPYPVEVIKARIRDGMLDDAPIWSDVRSFTKRNNQCRRFIRSLRKISDRLVITAGFPCQPFSVAGKRQGADDNRNIWPDTIRIIREIRPRYVFLENVPGLLARPHGYFGTILRELAESGYDAKWRVLSAAELGAPHRRDRLWIMAYDTRKQMGITRQSWSENGHKRANPNAQSQRTGKLSVRSRRQDKAAADVDGVGEDATRSQSMVNSDTKHCTRSPQQERKHQRAEKSTRGSRDEMDAKHDVADTYGQRRQEQRAIRGQQEKPSTESCSDQRQWWATEPAVGRVAHGVANRVGWIRAIGEGQVPVVAATAWDLLTGDDDE